MVSRNYITKIYFSVEIEFKILDFDFEFEKYPSSYEVL